MNIVIAGGSGFLGSALATALRGQNHSVAVLTRRPHGEQQIEWMPDGTVGAWAPAIEQADAVINLAGESLAAGRWTAERKSAIDNSRIYATRSLVNAIKAAPRKPEVLISASAIGYYGPHGDKILMEDAAAGTDFLATVCNQWEWEAQQAQSHARVVLLRTGLVLDGSKGALPEIARPFSLFAGGPVGSGDQYWSWIHLDDWVGIVLWALTRQDVSGPVNLTAPNPVTNAEFARTLGRAMRRPASVPAPAFMLRLLLGEMADALLLSGQRVKPGRAQWGGYEFRYPELDAALRAALVPAASRK